MSAGPAGWKSGDLFCRRPRKTGPEGTKQETKLEIENSPNWGPVQLARRAPRSRPGLSLLRGHQGDV